MQLGIHLSSGCADAQIDNPDKTSPEIAMRPTSYEGALPVHRDSLDLARNRNPQQPQESSWPASRPLANSAPALLDLPCRCAMRGLMVCGLAVPCSSMGSTHGQHQQLPDHSSPARVKAQVGQSIAKLKVKLCLWELLVGYT